jgi:K+ transporter
MAVVMTLGWAWQRRHGNAGIVDALWAFGLACAAVWLAVAGTGATAARLLVGVLGATWGLRLALHLWLRVRGEPEDGRYRALRAHWQGHQAKFFGFFQFQALLVVLFALDGAYLAANLTKIPDGGWLPLTMGIAIFTLLTTWSKGRALMRANMAEGAMPLEVFAKSAHSSAARVPGTAVFLTADAHGVPSALLHNIKHNKVLHEQNVFVTVCNHEVPWIGLDQRLEIEPLGHDCWQVIVHYGFKNDPDLPRALSLLEGRGVDLNPMTTSYFLSRDIVTPTLGSGMAPWREKLFAPMHHSATAAAEFLNLPSNAVVELGSKIEI